MNTKQIIIREGLVLIGLAIFVQIIGPEYDAREKIKYVRNAMITQIISKNAVSSQGSTSVAYVMYPKSVDGDALAKINAEVRRSFKNIVVINESQNLNVPVHTYFDRNGMPFKFKDSRIKFFVFFYLIYVCIVLIHWACARGRTLPKHRSFRLTK